MNYTIEEIDSAGFATLRYPDGSWAKVLLTAEMTEAELDNIAWNFRPKTGVKPDFLVEGTSRTAQEIDRSISDDRPAWLTSRIDAYGTLESQIEYITENGLEAWQSEVAAIKAQYPKE